MTNNDSKLAAIFGGFAIPSGERKTGCGLEVQILSPRPIVSNCLQHRRELQNRPTWFCTRSSSAPTRINTEGSPSEEARDHPQNRPQRCDGQTRCPTNCKLLNYKTRECSSAATRIDSPTSTFGGNFAPNHLGVPEASFERRGFAALRRTRSRAQSKRHERFSLIILI